MLPRSWAQAAVASVALQDGSAAAVQAFSRIPRTALDTAWTQAPMAARDCARANAVRLFGVTGPVCPDPKAPLWFPQRLGISPAKDRTGATWVLYFMNAKAQEEWAESMITRFMRQPPP